MAVLFHDNASSTRAFVYFTHFMPDHPENGLTAEDKSKGIEVLDSSIPPDPQYVFGKSHRLFINPGTKEMWHESFDAPLSQEEEIKLLKGEINPDSVYILLDKVNTPLEELRQAKLSQLNFLCGQTILGKFNSTVGVVTYQFSNDTEAQANFDKADRAFTKAYVTTMDWTVYDANGNVQRLTLDATKFETVYKDHLTHIQGNITKFRDVLMPQVLSATTNAEIDAVVW
jgi:hypothetical protein